VETARGVTRGSEVEAGVLQFITREAIEESSAADEILVRVATALVEVVSDGDKLVLDAVPDDIVAIMVTFVSQFGIVDALLIYLAGLIEEANTEDLLPDEFDGINFLHTVIHYILILVL
jgi:UPF0288 family protein (methanogenesis marker protein 3)